MNKFQYGIVDQKAPELRLNEWFDIDGCQLDEPVRLATLTNAVKIMYCFQSWCPGCHSSGFPTLKKILSHYENERLESRLASWVVQTVFEGHSANTIEKLHETQKRYQLDIPFAHDEQHPRPTVMTDYRTGGTPWFVIINQTNHVIFNDFNIGFEEAIKLIDGALAGQVVNTSTEAPKAVDDQTNGRFTVQLTELDHGYVDYTKKGAVLYLNHAEIPPGLRGQSYGAVLMEAVLEKIEQKNYKVIPVCSYIQSYFRRYQRWAPLLT